MRKNQEHPAKGKPRPHTWKIGPDPVRHARYFIWLQQRNQARFRKETWDLTFDQWLEVWGEMILQRGRKKNDYCMTRWDPEGPWDSKNAYIIKRGHHILQTRKNRDFFTNLAAERRARQQA